MLSDQELAHYVESLVRQTAARGGAGISADSVVRQLGAQLGVDVSPKAPLIRSVLVALLGPAAPAATSASATRAAVRSSAGSRRTSSRHRTGRTGPCT